MSLATVVEALTRLELWVAAFAGGAFGAAIGGLPSFVLCGILVIAGEAANTLGSFLAAHVPDVATSEVAVGFTNGIAFGPVFGPHISFAGAAAAAAYAAKKGYMRTGYEYHEAKNIGHAFGTKSDVLVVGGVFGLFGMVVQQSASGLGVPVDPVALSVVLSALCHRLVFGYDLVGTVRVGSILDMSPFERGEIYAEQSDHASDGGSVSRRLAVEPWLPHQYRWTAVALLGLIVGVLGAWIAVKSSSPFLGFGISAVSLVFLTLGVEQMPVTHHITLPAGTAALALSATQTPDLLSALLAGAAFGGFSALVGEFAQRLFYAHGSTHFDPPAVAIVVSTGLIAAGYLVGVFASNVWIPIP